MSFRPASPARTELFRLAAFLAAAVAAPGPAESACTFTDAPAPLTDLLVADNQGIGDIDFREQAERTDAILRGAPVIDPAKGAAAVASFGPAGVTDPALQSLFFPLVYRSLRQGRPLGEALRRAKAQALLEHPLSRPIVEGWNLLGDPALRLPAYLNPAGKGVQP